MPTKTCTHCKELKDLSEFTNLKNKKTGTCLKCNREYNRIWYKNSRIGKEDKRFKPRNIPLEERINILLTSGVCMTEEEALKFIKNI